MRHRSNVRHAICPLVCAAVLGGALLAAPVAMADGASATPPATAPAPIVVVVHTDDPRVTAAAVREAIARELAAHAVAPDDPAASSARGDVTITYRAASGELAVTYHDAPRGTVTRVVPAPASIGDVPREAALLAGNLGRDEAGEILGDRAPAPRAPTAGSEAAPRALHDEAAAEARPATSAPRRHPITIAALGGFGFNDSNANGGEALNLYGAGLGGRAGYRFAFGGYAGLSGAYHFGFEKTVNGAPAHGRVATLGLEIGYGIRLDELELRPYLGGGLAFYDAATGTGPSFEVGNGKKPALWPGVVATYDLTDYLFVGADIRYTFIVMNGDTAIVGAGQGSANGVGAFGMLGVRIPD